MTVTKLEEIENRRAARKEQLQARYDAQYVIDLEVLDGLEVEHGDLNISRVNLELKRYVPELPTMVICRTPSAIEMKRYTDRLKERKGQAADAQSAACELGATCRLYPAGEVYEQLEAARPGIRVQVGVEAANLAVGSTEAEAKS